MRRFRSFLTVFCFVIFGLGGFIMGTILFPLLILFISPKKQRSVLANVVHGSWVVFIKIMVFLRLIDVRILAQSNLKNIKGHIIVANHPTLLDVVLLIGSIPNTVCVVKSALLNNFFIKHIIQRVYLVNGDDPADFLDEAQEILSQGLNIVIFPEGTRTDNNTAKRWYRGFAQLALRAQAPILPVQIRCQPLVLGKLQKWYDLGVKTAIYHIKPLAQVKVSLDKKKNLHHQAKILSELVYSQIFKRIG